MKTNEQTYQNLQDWYNHQAKEVKYGIGVAIVVAMSIFAMGVDSLVDSGFLGFISGVLTCVGIGLLSCLAFLVIYWIAAAIAPEKTAKIFNALTKDPEDIDLD